MARKTLLIVGAGVLQVPAVEIARRAGLRVVITDRNPNAVAAPLADELVVLDTKDVPGHVELAQRLAAEGDLAGVFTQGADVEVTVAEAARAVGLPGADPAAARRCSNKAEFRRVCAAAGLPGPRFEEVDSLADAHLALRDVGVPAIVKALDNSGSRGATKVLDEEALPAAFEEALRWSGTGTAIVEECLAGSEQSVETIVGRDGAHHRCNVVDRLFGFDPFPVEIGHDNPSALGEREQAQLFELTEATARAVGIDLGAAKGDTMWTERGPVMLEMAARLSGGFHSQYTSPLAHGTADIKAALDLALGCELDPADVTPRLTRHSICRGLFPEPGLVTAVRGVDDALAVPGVEHVAQLVGPGDEIRPYRTSADRMLYVITVGDTREEALAAFERAAELIQVETEPAGVRL